MRFFPVNWVILSFLLLFWSCGQVAGTADATITEVPQDTVQTLTMLFVGDVMGHKPQIKAAWNPTTQEYDYNSCFQFVKPIIEKADVAIANLEVTLPGKPPYMGYPQFRSPDALATALKTAGFDIIVTANNHSNDSGKDGLLNTITTVEATGFAQTGTFRDAADREARYPMIFEKNGFRLAILNCTYGTNGLPDKAPTIVNRIDTAQIFVDIKKAKSYRPDAILAVMHWGPEYQLIESKEQRDVAHRLLKWGVDAVVGAHPHVVQPIRNEKVLLPDGNEKEGIVVYSMGNFVSNQRQANTDGGLMVGLTLTKTPKPDSLQIDSLDRYNMSVGDVHYYPVWRYIYNKKAAQQHDRSYHIIPVSAFEGVGPIPLGMDIDDINKMNAFALKTRTHLANNGGFPERKTTKLELYGETGAPDIAAVEVTKPAVQEALVKETTIAAVAGTKPTVKKVPVKETTIAATTSTEYFRVQWKATKQRLAAEPPTGVNLEVVSEDGWYKYLLGKETNRSKAEEILKKIKAKGFDDAYIITTKD